MKMYKDRITEELDRCLLTDEEWEQILKTKMTLDIEEDPFKESVPEDE